MKHFKLYCLVEDNQRRFAMGGQSSAARRSEPVTPVKLVPAENLVARRNEIHQLIAQRAFALFESRGCQHGRDFDDWTEAEDQVLYSFRHDLKESGALLIFLANLPGSFTAAQLSVCVEPRRVMVSGEREISVMCADAEGGHTERRLQRIFETENLPVDIDPSRTAARLEGELLEIVMPKTS
jgi:HSP20 family molecular chaperone IbpA